MRAAQWGLKRQLLNTGLLGVLKVTAGRLHVRRESSTPLSHPQEGLERGKIVWHNNTSEEMETSGQ